MNTDIPHKESKVNIVWKLCEEALKKGQTTKYVYEHAADEGVEAATTRTYICLWRSRTRKKLTSARGQAREQRIENLLENYRAVFGRTLPWKRYLRTEEIKKAIENKIKNLDKLLD
jgi:hypothetical protein